MVHHRSPKGSNSSVNKQRNKTKKNISQRISFQPPNPSHHLPSTSDVSRVTLAALRLPAGKFNPILSSFSLKDLPPFFDFALFQTLKKHLVHCYYLQNNFRVFFFPPETITNLVLRDNFIPVNVKYGK